MEQNRKFLDFLKGITTADLWAELARRFNVKYGKIQMVFHGGRPSEFADIDVRVNIAQSESSAQRSGGIG